MLTLTETAKKKFVEIIAAENRAGQGLRVTVEHGGTPAPEFALNFVIPEEIVDDDTIVDLGELKVYVNSASAKFLEGATIDFIETIQESGFKVDAPNSGVVKPSGPEAEALQKTLDEKINPSIASHGGFIDLIAVEAGTAYLRFGGGCQGCGMVNVTLKQGVEKVIFADVPAITKVMDVTDHASGANPYYQPAK